MNFLNPLLLWGLPLASLPVIIHLLRKNKVVEIEWAAMDFLLDVVQEQKKRFQLEDILLLVLRTLLIIFLILALARPVIQSGMGSGGAQKMIVLDNSLSMATQESGRSRFAKAVESSNNIVASGKNSYALLISNSHSQPLISNFTEDKALVNETLKQLEPGDYDGDPAQTVKSCLELIEQSAEIKPIVYLISDFQRTDWAEPDELLREKITELQEKAEFYFIYAGGESSENLSLTKITPLQDAAKLGQESWFTVRVQNHGTEDANDVEVKFYLNNEVRESQMTSVPAGQGIDLIFKIQVDEAAYHSAHAELSPDKNLRDNKVYTHFQAMDKKQVLVVQNFIPRDVYEKRSLFFDFALNPFPNASASEKALYDFQWRDTAALETEELGSFAFIILDNVQALTSSEMDSLEQYIADGGGVLINLGPDSDIENFNKNFAQGQIIDAELSSELISMEKDKAFLDTRITNPDSELWSFADQAEDLESFKIKKTFGFKKSDNSQMRSYMDLKTEQGALSIISSAQYKKGKIFIFASGFSLEWNNFASQPNFLPLSRHLSRQLLRDEYKNEPLMVGQSYFEKLGDEKSRSSFELETPAGDKESYNVEIRNNAPYLNIPQLTTAGVYRLNESEEEDFKLIAVNTREKESEVQCLKMEELQASYPDVKVLNGADLSQLSSTQGASSLVKFFLLLAALCWLGENILGMMISRRSQA